MNEIEKLQVENYKMLMEIFTINNKLAELNSKVNQNVRKIKELEKEKNT